MPRPKGAPARLLDDDTRLRWWPSGDPAIGKAMNRVIQPGENPSRVLAEKLAELTATAGNLIDVALKHLEAVPHPGTRAEYESRLRTWVLPHLLNPKGRTLLETGRLNPADLPRHSLPVAAFTNALLEAVLSDAVANGATENTVDKLDAYLGAMGSHLVNTDVVKYHPLGDKRRHIERTWKKEAKRRNKPRSTRPDEVPDWDHVLEWADAAGNRLKRGREAVLVYAGTGMRLAELPALHTHEVDRAAGEIVINGQLTRHDGIIPCPKDVDRRRAHYWGLIDPVLDGLIAEADHSGLLFPAEGAAVWYDTLTRELKLAARDCGFAWTIRDLRAHYCTYNLAPTSAGGYGKQMAEVQRWMGHSHISITLGHYNRMRSVLGVTNDELPPGVHPSQMRPRRHR